MVKAICQKMNRFIIVCWDNGDNNYVDIRLVKQPRNGVYETLVFTTREDAESYMLRCGHSKTPIWLPEVKLEYVIIQI